MGTAVNLKEMQIIGVEDIDFIERIFEDAAKTYQPFLDGLSLGDITGNADDMRDAVQLDKRSGHQPVPDFTVLHTKTKFEILNLAVFT